MARIKLQTPDSETPEIKAVFDEIKEKTGGTVPAAYRAFGRHAHILQANWNRTKRVLSEGNLAHSFKEQIALAVSSANGCLFCVNIHSNNLIAQGFVEEVVSEVKLANSEDEQTDFVLKFCVKASKTPEQISDADFDTLKGFGYSEEDILEILTVMEMYTGYNKIIVALGLQIAD